MGKYKKDIRGGLTDAQSSIRSQRFAGKRKAEFFPRAAGRDARHHGDDRRVHVSYSTTIFRSGPGED